MEAQTPYNAAPPKKVKQDKKAFVIAIIVVAVILGACGMMKFLCSSLPSMKNISEDKNTNETLEPDVSLYAGQLFNDYQKNEVAADQKYKNKILSVTGGVSAIRKDFMNDIVIDLTTDNQFMSVSCRIKKKFEDKAARLSKGGTVTVVGKCTGMIIGSPQLDNCEIK